MRSKSNEPDAVTSDAASSSFDFPTSLEPESAAWHRQPDESNLHFARFDRYRLLGPTRTLLGCVHAEEAQRGAKKLSKNVSGAWRKAYESHQWKARAEAWDTWERARIEAQRQAYIDGILQEGYALTHERVKSLGLVAKQLEGYLGEPDKVFLADVKSIGYGEFTERVDLITFNDALFEQYRKYLADIAAEMGGRVKQVKQEATVAIDVTGAKDSLFNKLAAFAQKTAADEPPHP